MKTTATFYNAKGVQVGKYPLYNSASFDERRDEQLDTGTIQVISTEESLSFADFCPVLVEVEDIDGTKKTMQFCGFKSLEQRGVNYYIHSIELVEPTRLLMGIIIEGRKITQPIDGSGKAKKSLLDVLDSLLNAVETLEADFFDTPSPARFGLNVDGKLQTLLMDTISPEFHWEAGTLLWECLCDVGNVINAVPRLVAIGYNPIYEWITFDLINEEEGEYEI